MQCEGRTRKGARCLIPASWGQRVCTLHGAIKPIGYHKQNIPGQAEDSPYATVDAPPGATRVYTDGACNPNPGTGGWGWVVQGRPDSHGYGWAPSTTNQRMEILAALQAVISNPGPLVVVSDSMYVVRCMRDGWWEKWLRFDWHRNQTRTRPVMNADLWQPLVGLVTGGGRPVVFQWVRGHNGDHWNEHADGLAEHAATTRPGEPTSLDGLPAWEPAPELEPALSLW